VKAPFPYFGGKSGAAQTVWAALGPVRRYIEPFFGSGAVLLARPPHTMTSARPYECANDADGLLVNVWRSIQRHPDEVWSHANQPAHEVDLHAKHRALIRWRESGALDRLVDDPRWCDPEMAGWWVWGLCNWIGGRWGACMKRQKPAETQKGILSPSVIGDGPSVLRALSARLATVATCYGPWERVVTASYLFGKSLGHRVPVGVFLDPPYSAEAGMGGDLYAADDLSVAHDVRRWCLEWGSNPSLRIVLAGFDIEHAELEAHGWRAVEWFIGPGGYANGDHQMHRERLWLSPHCLDVDAPRQESLF
jgi:DNA adenine methylase